MKLVTDKLVWGVVGFAVLGLVGFCANILSYLNGFMVLEALPVMRVTCKFSVQKAFFPSRYQHQVTCLH